jgi:ArsR family metal-binding transcriptional regulator
MKFDYVFAEQDSNQLVFKKSLAPALSNVLKGYQTTVLCYGMTGAGKTFTMFGDGDTKVRKSPNAGLVYQAVQELFDIINRIEDENVGIGVRVSFIEIYNESVLPSSHCRLRICSVRTCMSTCRF